MVIENDPSARMQVRTLGELQHPGQCMVCGSGNCTQGYLDLGVFFDYEGHCYLCWLCAFQAGETVGLYTPEEVEQVQNLATKLASENEALKEELAHVQPLADAFAEFSRSVITDVADLSSESDGVEVSSESAESSTDTVEGSDDGEPEPKEPVKGSGPSDVSKPKRRDFTFS